MANRKRPASRRLTQRQRHLASLSPRRRSPLSRALTVEPGQAVPAVPCPFRTEAEHTKTCWLCKKQYGDLLPEVLFRRWIADGCRKHEHQF
jgi:hypothetical protein